MKRPSFQFYPADWKGNAKLRRSSEAARGAWMDILCVLHDSDEYGVCRWPLADLARTAGVAPKLAKELAAKDVLKGSDTGPVIYVHTPRHAGKDGEPVKLVSSPAGPCWYCSRMVRDEWARQRRNPSQFTTESQPKATPKPSPIPPIGDRSGDGSSSPSSSEKEPVERNATLRAALPPKPNVEIPDWIPPEPWAGFVEMRRKIRAPMTDRAVQLIIDRLRKLRATEDIGAVLDQSTSNSWRDVFPLKQEANRGSNGNQKPPVQSFGASVARAVDTRAGRAGMLDRRGPEIVIPGSAGNSAGDDDADGSFRLAAHTG